MSRLEPTRRFHTTRLDLEHLEDRNLFDVAFGALIGDRQPDPLASLSQSFDQHGLPLGNGHARTTLVTPEDNRVHSNRQSGGMAESITITWKGEQRHVVPGSWIIHYDGLGSARAAQTANFNSILRAFNTGLQVTDQLEVNDWYQFSAPASFSASTVTTAASLFGGVMAIEPVFADYHAMYASNDQYFGDQLGLNNTGQYGWLPDADIDATEAWGHLSPVRGSTEIVASVIDTGVDYTHPDLYKNIWLNQAEIPSWVTATDTDGDGLITFWDLNEPVNAGFTSDLNGTGYIDAGDLLLPDVDGGWMDGVDGGSNGFTDDLIGWDFTENDADPYDWNMHGTHVAGIFGATGDNGIGVAGINWKTQIMVVKGLDDSGYGSDDWLSDAITYSVDNGARLSNTSWGGSYSSLIDAAVVYAGSYDHLITAAAGNESNDNDAFPDYSYPASLPYDNVISVGATDFYDLPAYFTNYGATTVDLMAPGQSILSTVPTWWYGGYYDPGYELFDGTSMAAPHVAGAAALLWSTDPGASLADIRSAILNGVDYLPDLDPVTGYAPVASGGRLNLMGALQQLNPDALFVVSTSPSDGEIIYGAQPATYVVTFNSAVQLSGNQADLQASDFSVNGVQATGVTLSPDGLTATFTFASAPITVEGLVTLGIAPGSVRRVDTAGTISNGYEGNFRYDSLPLAVIGTDPPAGSTFSLGDTHTIRVYFNEVFDPGSIKLDTFKIWFMESYFGYTPISATPVLGNTALDLTFNTLLDTEEYLTLFVDPNALTDQFGNPNLDYFSADYTTDIVTLAYPVPLVSLAPLGSLMATGSNASIVTRWINPGVPGGDTDDFTINMDAGQLLNVYARPSDAGLRPRLEVYNSANVLVASVDASAAGQSAMLQSVPLLTSGQYKIRVKGLNGTTGHYQLFLSPNTSLEEEGRLAGVTNNTPGTAQSLDSSFLKLSTDLAAVSRGAVIGNLGGAVDANPGTVVYLADFESGNNGFTINNTLGASNGYANGFWHRTERRGSDPNHSSSHSFWYGNEATGNYYTGTSPNVGVIVSPVISLPVVSSGLFMDFKYFLDSRGGYQDFVFTQISADGGSTWTTLNNNYPYQYPQTPGGWAAIDPVNLSAYMGQNIQLRFGFNSVFLSDIREGWYLDDIRIFQNNPRDYYSITAKAGERIGSAIAAFSGTQPYVVELLAPNGSTVLGTSSSGATNVSGALSGVTIPADGTYYLRVTGSSLSGYDLVVTRNVVFGLEPNNLAANGQALAGAQGALGYIESTPSQNAVDSGWYDSTGFHDSTRENYIAGQFTNTSTLQYRDWFVFDVPVATGPITAARLELFNPSIATNGGNGYVSPDASETFTLFDVSTPIATLRAGGSGLTGIFDDLGTGVAYGSVTVTAASNGTFVVINLNAAGIAAVNAAQGGQLAFGGALTTIVGTATQHIFGFSNGTTRRLVITPGPAASSDWYSVTLAGDQTALQVETRTPADGPGELRNVLNPRIEVYNAAGTTLIASGTALADGRNEKIRVTGLTPGAKYQVRISSEGGTVGEYFVSITPLRVPTITSKVDDQLPLGISQDGTFLLPILPSLFGWSNHTGAGWQNDYTVHTAGVFDSILNSAVWTIRATSSNPELFTTWVPQANNATNATYKVFYGLTLLNTVVMNQQTLPNDGLLFGNTYVESLGKFTGISVNSYLTVVLLTQGANGNVVADGVFDPPTTLDLAGDRTRVAKGLVSPSTMLTNLAREVQVQSNQQTRTPGESYFLGRTPQQFASIPNAEPRPWHDSYVDDAFIRSYNTLEKPGLDFYKVNLIKDNRTLPDMLMDHGLNHSRLRIY